MLSSFRKRYNGSTQCRSSADALLYHQTGFGETAAATKTHGHTSQKDQLLDISFFVSHASSLYPSIPLYLFGHSMGGGLVLAYATKSPKSPGLDKVKGVLASSPLLRQSPGVRSSLLIVRAGGLVGKLSGKLTMPAAVKPEVSLRGVEGMRKGWLVKRR